MPPTSDAVLGPIGIWTWTLDGCPYAEVVAHARLIEELGYAALWFKEDFGRDALTTAALLLSATDTLPIANGVASMVARDPVAMRSAQRCLAEAHPGRHVLGVGVSHRPHAVARGQAYGRPASAASAYLRAMGEAALISPEPKAPTTTLLAALGPRMLAIAREQADGVHTFGAMPEHTHRARAILGAGPLLAPVQPVVLDDDPVRGRATARTYVELLFGLAHYRANWERLGYGAVTDELVDAAVAIGDESSAARRIQEHFDAGADHVAVQLVPTDLQTPPADAWRRFAPVASDLARRRLEALGRIGTA